MDIADINGVYGVMGPHDLDVSLHSMVGLPAIGLGSVSMVGSSNYCIV